MLVEILTPRIESQPLTSTAEITSPRVPLVDSMKTISLSIPGTHLVGRVAEKTAFSGLSTGISISSEASERFRHYKKGRSPRCSHGKRINDRSHQCERGVLSPISLIRIPFLKVVQGFKTDQKSAA